MKNLFFFLILLLFSNFQSQELKDFEIPKGYTKIFEGQGDLDKDGKNEIIFVFNTDKKITSDFNNGFVREFFILKNINGKLKIWKKNSSIILASEVGFYPEYNKLDLSIKNNCLVITQIFNTNSRHTQTYKHTFRYQNGEFYLIGSHDRFEDTCDFNILHEANFSTGKIIINKEYSSCDEEQNNIPKNEYLEFNHKFTALIKMNDFRIGEHKLKIPKSNNYFIY